MALSGLLNEAGILLNFFEILRQALFPLTSVTSSGSRRLPPQLILCPGREGTHIANLAISELLLKGGDRQTENLHVLLFRVALMRTSRQFFGDKNVLTLANEAICHPHPGQFGHAAGG